MGIKQRPPTGADDRLRPVASGHFLRKACDTAGQSRGARDGNTGECNNGAGNAGKKVTMAHTTIRSSRSETKAKRWKLTKDTIDTGEEEEEETMYHIF